MNKSVRWPLVDWEDLARYSQDQQETGAQGGNGADGGNPWMNRLYASQPVKKKK